MYHTASADAHCHVRNASAAAVDASAAAVLASPPAVVDAVLPAEEEQPASIAAAIMTLITYGVIHVVL